MLAVTAGLFAQKANVRRAENLALQEKPDFNGARSAIQEAFNNDATKNDPKTYYVAGVIGFTENEYFNKLLMIGQDDQVDKQKKGKAIMESYNYFLKAYELDHTPNAKGKVKPKYTKKIKEHVLEYFTAQHNMVAYGADLYERREFMEAAKIFDTFLEIPMLPMMGKELSTKDSTYLMIKYFSGLSYTNGGAHDKAIKVYESLKHEDYETVSVYQLLSEEYNKIDDDVKYLEVLEEGFKIFPDDPWFLQNIINFYIQEQKIEEAAAYLDAAIKQAPDVAEYYYVKGNIEERLEKMTDARKSFEKALELQPNMANAYAGIGRLIFNDAVEMLKKADNIRDNREYNKAVEEANVVFRESMPYLEKAVEMDSANNDFKQTLKMLYYRLGEDEKYNEISKELGE